MNPTICGLGTCSVTSDGLYQCTCQDGAMITGSNTDGSLICIGMYILIFEFYCWIFTLCLPISDIDECSANMDICGLGLCINNDDGEFYDCECTSGSQPVGSSATGTLQCVGETASFNATAMPRYCAFSL